MKLVILSVFVPLLTSCTSAALKQETLSQARTLTDLQYQIILDNVAMQRDSKDTLPWHVKLSEGQVTINDSISPSAGLEWSPTARTLQLEAGREWQVSWTLVPVTDAEQLRGLRVIYMASADYDWIKNGSAEDGCPSGTYGDESTWVAREDIGKLSDLVLKVLEAAPMQAEERLFLNGRPSPTIRN